MPIQPISEPTDDHDIPYSGYVPGVIQPCCVCAIEDHIENMEKVSVGDSQPPLYMCQYHYKNWTCD